MERQVDRDDRWLDDHYFPTDGAGGAEPPGDDPGDGPGRTPRPPDPDPETGPWYPLSMAVFVAWSAVTFAAMAAGARGGPLLAWVLISCFLSLYVLFLVIGATWFSAHRAAGRR